MKWSMRIALGFLTLVALVLSAAALLVDAERIGVVFAQQLSTRLGQPIEVGQVELDLLPSPSVRMRDVALRTESEASPFLRAEQLRLKLSLLNLILGRVVLNSVEIDAPRLRLELDEDGYPIFPLVDAGVDAHAHATATADDEAAIELLEISSLRVRNGVAQLGPHAFEAVQLDGEEGGLDGNGLAFDFEADLVGFGSIRKGRLETSRLSGDSVRWTTRLSLVDVDLSELSAHSNGAEGRMEGSGRADLVLAGVGASVEEGSAEVALRSLDLPKTSAWGVGLTGDVDLSLEIGKEWEADLTHARTTLGARFAKPVGARAHLSGPLPSARAIRAWNHWELLDSRIQLSDSVLQGDLRMIGGQPSFQLSGEIDFARLAGWSITPRIPATGRLVIEDLVYAPPLPVQAAARVEDVVLPIAEKHHAKLSGPISIVGDSVAGKGLELVFLDQPFAIEGIYDIPSERFDLDISAPSNGIDVGRIFETLEQDPTLTGRAYGRVTLRGPFEAKQLHGFGSAEILNGKLEGAHLGDVAAAHRGKPRTTGLIPFQRLSAAFDVFDGGLEVSRLVMDQDDVTAELAGRIALDSVRLSGEAVFYEHGELVRQGFGVKGTPFAFRGHLIDDPPEDSEEHRERSLTMLEAMYDQMLEMPEPEDPQIAEAFSQRLRTLESRLEALQN